MANAPQVSAIPQDDGWLAKMEEEEARRRQQEQQRQPATDPSAAGREAKLDAIHRSPKAGSTPDMRAGIIPGYHTGSGGPSGFQSPQNTRVGGTPRNDWNAIFHPSLVPQIPRAVSPTAAPTTGPFAGMTSTAGAPQLSAIPPAPITSTPATFGIQTAVRSQYGTGAGFVPSADPAIGAAAAPKITPVPRISAVPT